MERAGSDPQRAGCGRAGAERAHAVAAGIVGWYRAEARDLPWRRPGFTPWAHVVSEFMLQQTPVVRVLPKLSEWLERWPSPATLAAETPGEAVRAWDRLGYPRRALALHATAVAIVERHGGEVPRDVDALLALPGVGAYTARAIAAFAFGVRTPVVDTNTRRVLARAIAARAHAGPPHARADLAAMEALLPEDATAAGLLNAGAMELGAIVCTARAPRCNVCPIRNVCAWRAAGHPDEDDRRRRVQPRYAGSDRELRGLVLRQLRASDEPVPRAALAALHADADRLERILAGLVRDRLAVHRDGAYGLG